MPVVDLHDSIFSQQHPHWASQVAQWGRIHLPIQEMPEIWVRSLGWEDPLEHKMATCSSILAWKNPMQRGAWQAVVPEVAESDVTEHTSTHPNQQLLNLYPLIILNSVTPRSAVSATKGRPCLQCLVLPSFIPTHHLLAPTAQVSSTPSRGCWHA